MQQRSIKIGLISLLYLIAIICFYFFFWVPKSEIDNLTNLIATEEQSQMVMSRSVARRPELESQLAETKKLVREYEALIPQAYDLTLVLQTVNDVAESHQVDLERLQYQLLHEEESDQRLSLNLQVKGEFPDIFQMLMELKAKMPSLAGKYFNFTSDDFGNVELVADLDLYMIPQDWSAITQWQPDYLDSDYLVGTPANVFGPSLNQVQQFYNGSIKLLGVITSSEKSRALISKQGVEQWKQVGDFIGTAQITKIERNSLKLDAKGLEISLSMGG